MANTDFIPNDFIPDISTTNTTSNPSANPGYFQSLFKTYSPQNNPDLNAILGAGDALRNTIASGANLIPGVNIPLARTGQGTAYNIGNVAGNLGAFAGGGELLDAARLGAEGIPYIGKALSSLSDNPAAQGLMQQYLPGIARRAIGTGAYGVATNPNDRLTGGAEGIGGSLLSEALPPAFGLAGNAAQYFMPTTFMQKIIQGLGGNKSLEDATKSVIGNVKDAYENQQAIAKNMYKPIFNSVGGDNIYSALDRNQQINPDFWANALNGKINDLGTNSQYYKLPDDISNYYPYDVKKLNNNFQDNPTFDNAHQLQSQMGTEIRRLGRKNCTRCRVFEYNSSTNGCSKCN